jgi:PAS domain S-box-containing protein
VKGQGEPSAILASYMVTQSPDGIVVADHEGTISLWNSSAERIFGYSSSEAVGKSLNIIIPERFQEAHWSGYHRALTEGKTKYSGQSLPTRSLRKDGATIYVELTFAVIRGTEGQVLGAMANVRDITERYMQERQLRKRLTELERPRS